MKNIRLSLLAILLSVSLSSLKGQYTEFKTYEVLDDFEITRNLLYKSNSLTIPLGPVPVPSNSQGNPSYYCAKVTTPIDKRKKMPSTRFIEFTRKNKSNKSAEIMSGVNFRENPKITLKVFYPDQVWVGVEYIDEGLAEQIGSSGVVAKKGIALNKEGPSKKWKTVELDFSEYAFYEPIGKTRIKVQFTPMTKNLENTEIYFDDIFFFTPKN